MKLILQLICLLDSNLYDDLIKSSLYLKKVVSDLYRGNLGIEGIITIGPGATSPIVQSKLGSLLKEQALSFFGHGDGKHFLLCQDLLKIPSDHIYIYTNVIRKNQGNGLCADSQDNIIAAINKVSDIPFYMRWLGYNKKHLELGGTYLNFAIDNFKLELCALLLTGSTIIVTAATDHAGLHSISDELILNSFTQYISNPYIRYIQYVFTNTRDSTIAIRTDTELAIFTTKIAELEGFSNQHIVKWQQEKVQDFVVFFNNLAPYLHGKEKLEFQHFIQESLFTADFKPLHYLINLQEQHLSRYKELLLFNAIAQNDIAKLQALLNSGININKVALMNNITPIYVAALLAHFPITKLLFDSGAILDASRSDSKATPLMAAILSNSENITKLLLMLGANVNAHDVDKNTPLHFAVQKGNSKIVELLIKAKINLDAQNKSGDSALVISADLGYAGIVEQLLKAGANHEIANNNLNTPLIVASRGGHTDVIKALLTYGAKVNAKNNKDDTPLSIAIENHNIETIKILLAAAGASFEFVASKGKQIIISEIKQKHLDILDLLAYNLKDISIIENLANYKLAQYKEVIQYTLSNSTNHSESSKVLMNYLLMNSHDKQEIVDVVDELASCYNYVEEYITQIKSCISNLAEDISYSSFFGLCSNDLS